ncbi:hypothetical protein [Nostoc sp. PCC 9305]|uniref:hypothetical protein n=1 Tax=Nostoc sp. PCC 9305 TaxID=296636 RepID=UPI0039C5FA35
MKNKHQNASQRAIAFLLAIQVMLIGVNAENLIQQGDSPITVLLWVVKESISLVRQASSLQEKQKKSLLPKHRRSEEE